VVPEKKTDGMSGEERSVAANPADPAGLASPASPASGAEKVCGAGGPACRTLLPVYGVLLVALLLMAWVFLSDESPGTDAAWTGFPLDDAWIHMVYSRSLATTGLPCYNGSEAENGFTSPLWMILGVLPQWAERSAGLSAVTGVKVLGLFFGWLAACAAASFLLRTGCRLPAAAFGGLLVALAPPLVFAALSGMEVTLAILLLISAFSAYRSGAFLRAGVLSAFALLARPEAILLPALLAVLLLWENRVGFGRRLFGLAKLLAPGSAAIGAWVGYSLYATGLPLPNTFYMKFQGGEMLSAAPFSEPFVEAWRQLGPMVLVPLAVLSLVGIVRALRLAEGKVFAVAPFVFGLVFLFAIWATREMPAGCMRYYYWWRYLLPALPFLLLPAVFGLDLVAGIKGGKGARLAGAGAAILLGGFVLFAVCHRYAAVAGQYAWNCRNINEVQVDLGRWIDRNLPPGAAVAVNDAGALRYFGNRRTIDLIGLNRHEGIGEMERGEAFPMLPLPEKARWLHERAIYYMAVFPCWFPHVDMAARRNSLIEIPGPSPRQAGRFERLTERKSDHYTITEAPPPGKIGQNVKALFMLTL
jgi:arabinofuranosyltransferase